jgi:hypothetical protein
MFGWCFPFHTSLSETAACHFTPRSTETAERSFRKQLKLTDDFDDCRVKAFAFSLRSDLGLLIEFDSPDPRRPNRSGD